MHQICEDNNFKAVFPTVKGPWGGKAVNDEFLKFLSELVGQNVWHEFKMTHMEDYFEIERSFEVKKQRSIPDNWLGKIRLALPHTLIKLCVMYHRVNTFEDVIKKNIHSNHVRFREGKLVFDNILFFNFFQKPINEIVKLLDEHIQRPEANDITSIFLVGGFSHCLFLKKAITKRFKNVCIFMPAEPDIVVLKGAVCLGHAWS